MWTEDLTGGGTAAHQTNEANVKMDVTTTGDKVIRQSRRYLVYEPGKSSLVLCTGVLGSASGTKRKSTIYFFKGFIFLFL